MDTVGSTDNERHFAAEDNTVHTSRSSDLRRTGRPSTAEHILSVQPISDAVS